MPAYMYVVALSALLVGGVIGWLLGLRQGRRELRAYRLGLEEEQARQLQLAKRMGGPCWVKGQLPPQAQD